jgi:CarD family transcriptional regulator
MTKEGIISSAGTGEHEMDEVEASPPEYSTDYAVGDYVVYPHHGAGKVLKREVKEVFGKKREYLIINILHNDMTVMVPADDTVRSGLRRVIDDSTMEQVFAVLRSDMSQMPKNWSRRFKYNREKIKTGDVFEIAEVVRNLTIRDTDKGLSTGEKQMFTRAKKILASELMHTLQRDEQEAERYLHEVIVAAHMQRTDAVVAADP